MRPPDSPRGAHDRRGHWMGECGLQPFQQTGIHITAGPREEPKARVQGSHEKRPRTAAGRYCASDELEL